MLGLVKQCLYKATERAKLTKQELKVILDTEINLNNRPVMYIDDKIRFPVLTPNILIHGQPSTIPEKQFDDDGKVIKKRQQYIKRCKDAAWNRWNNEYQRSLIERHNMKNNQRHMKIAIGDVVLIKGDDKNRGKWNIGIVEELCEMKDNVIRAVKLSSWKKYIERPIQFLHPLEFGCDTWKRQKTVHQCSKQPLTVNTNEFKPRRNAIAIAEVQI